MNVSTVMMEMVTPSSDNKKSSDPLNAAQKGNPMTNLTCRLQLETPKGGPKRYTQPNK